MEIKTLVFISINYYININIRGIVIIEIMCETIAIPADMDVSFPYALGITMMFKPSGIANVQRAQINIVCGISKKRTINM